jgi:hypothetical protein
MRFLSELPSSKNISGQLSCHLILIRIIALKPLRINDKIDGREIF